MKYILLAAGALLLPLATPALAEPSCDVQGQAVPMWQVAKTFEEAGGAIRTIKVTNGCYEIYGTEGDKRVEVFYDPQTGAELSRQ